MASEALAEVVDKPLAEKDPIRDWLEHQEKKVFDASVRVLEDALCFRDIGGDEKVVPEEWVEEIGPIEAEKRFRLAKAAWLNAKEAPVGIKVAKELVTGIAKARARENQGPRVLNLQKVVIHTGTPVFPEIEVEK